MTLPSYRCLPDGGRSRPRPASLTLDATTGLAARGPHAAVDAYGRPAGRPRWLAGEYLALLERQGRGVGVVYLLHFDQPIGDLANPRGFASHYTGWTLDLPARLTLHARGRGARLMEVVGEQGIGWQLARIWTGTRTRECSLKRSGGAARRCPSAGSPPAACSHLGRSIRWRWSSAPAPPPSRRPSRRWSCRRRWPHDPPRPRGEHP